MQDFGTLKCKVHSVTKHIHFKSNILDKHIQFKSNFLDGTFLRKNVALVTSQKKGNKTTIIYCQKDPNSFKTC